MKVGADSEASGGCAEPTMKGGADSEASGGSSKTSKEGFVQYMARRRREGGVGSNSQASEILKEYVAQAKGCFFSGNTASQAANMESESRTSDVSDQPADPMSKLAAFKATLKQQEEQREPARRREHLENAMKELKSSGSQKRRKKEDGGNRVEMPLPQFPQRTTVGDPSLRRNELAQVLRERISEKKVLVDSAANIDLSKARDEITAPRMSWDWQPDKVDNAKKVTAGNSALEIEIPDDRGSTRSLAQAELRRAVNLTRVQGMGIV